ncbi:MAG: T9SS type A sorting domain-containing protein [Bacteroidetes bacterium]|nr:T9SS type A sorting domain-containing protein [Bacteroidota bacterium]
MNARMIRSLLFGWLLILFTAHRIQASPSDLACTAPSVLNVLDVSSTSALLDWVPAGDNDSWELAVLPVGSPPPTMSTHAAAVVPFSAAALTPGTHYTFYVRAVCGAEMSSWVQAPATFYTNLVNPSACQLELDIPDPGCLDLGIDINGVPASSMGIDVVLAEVRVILSHEWTDDVEISLENTAGTLVALSMDNGGSDDNYGDPEDGSCLTYTAFVSDQLADNCNQPNIQSASAPFIGSFLPENSLAYFNDGSDPNGEWTIHVCDDAGTDIGVLQYVELVFENLVCPGPSTVQLVDSDSTSLTIDWLPGSNCSSSIVEYGPVGFMPGDTELPGGGTVILSGCPPFTITDLNPDTPYEIYIREDCGGNYSPNSCVLFGMTDCSPPAFTFSEDVEGVDICGGVCSTTCGLNGSSWTNSQADAVDWLVNSGPTPTTSTGPSDDVSGGGRYFYLEASGGCPNGSAAELYSPCLSIVADPLSTCHFSFWYHMYGTAVNSLMLEITTDEWVTTDTLWQQFGDQGDMWIQQFIDLSVYDGQEAQMRFTGFEGDNARGDIGLDELTFYGSTNEGLPSNIYYLDNDNDGYGNTDVFVILCASNAPAGFVDLPGDCNDDNPTIYPNQPESPCDGIDLNCNGDGDEYDLPPPVVSNDTICSGELGLVEAVPGYFGQISWYDAPSGGNLLHVGNSYVPIPPPDIMGNTPQTFSYYAEEENFLGCLSTVRAEAVIYVRPKPDLFIPDDQFAPECAGEEVDLSQWVVQDLNNTGISLSYHSSLPANADNVIDPPLVVPAADTWYYVLGVSDEGCTDVDSILVETAPSPIAEITGPEEICLLEEALLQVVDAGSGVQPFQYLWSNATAQTSVGVTGFGPVGTEQDYSVTITAANGCVSTDSITVTTISSFAGIAVNVSDVSICGGTDGSILVSPSGGVPPFTYSWSGTSSGSVNGQNGNFLLEDLQQGAYSVTVVDSSPAACPFVLPNLIVDGPLASVSIVSVTNADCYAQADGCIEIEVDGTDPDILWSTGDTTELVCDLPAGFYNVTVTDGACESVITDIEVTQPDSLFGKVSQVVDVSCNGFSDGAVFIVVSGGQPPYTYEWSDGSSDPQLQDVPSGEYYATVTDANGCIWEGGPFEISEPDALVLQSAVEQVDCNDAGNGRIEVIATGGTAPYSYFWSNGGNAPFIEFLEPGTYEVTVLDFRSCSITESFEITEPTPLAIGPLEPINASCFGLDDGSMLAQAFGGSPPYDYAWSNGDTTALADSLGVGFYTLTITDSLDCVIIYDSLEITAPEAIDLGFNLDSTSCLGVADGIAEAAIITGTPPLAYAWSNGDTGAVADSLDQGVYTLTVTDGAGCIDTFSVEVGAQQPLVSTISSLDPNCYEGDNGAIFTTIMGGDPQYTYAWNNGLDSPDIQDLAAGAYVLTVTDEDGCFMVTDTIFLENPPEIIVEIDAIDSILCAGDSSGAIYVTASGGGENFQYNWSNEEITDDILNLPAGTYSLTVVDGLNCSFAPPSIVLGSPDPLEVDVINLDDQVDCLGNTVDTVYLDVTGGMPPYQFAWSDGSDLPYLADMDPGEYTVTITDQNACMVIEEEIKIPEPIIPLKLSQNLDLLTVEDCDYSGGTSQLQVLIEGDGAPYQYNWSFGGNGTLNSDTLNAPALNPGYYALTVTDGNGCVSEIDSLLVTDFDGLSLSVLPNNIHPVSCYGGSDGWINLFSGGGVPPYEYVWTNLEGDTVSLEEDAMGLPFGEYQIEMIDFNECSIVLGGLLVNQPADSLDLDFSVINNFCYGYNNGVIDISVTGGTSPYHYAWSNGDMEEDINGLPSDYYSVTVTDNRDCIFVEDSIFISQPLDSIEIDTVIVSNVSCFGDGDGMIDLQLVGANGPYSFFWNNNKFTEDISDLSPGFYYCTIVDISGCQMMTDTFEISQPPQLLLNMSSTDENAGEQDGTATADASGGVPPLTFEWNTLDTTATIDSLESGFYQVLVTDSLGCMIDGVVFVDLNDSVDAVTEYLTEVQYSLYPNPTSGELWVELVLPDSRELTLEITDVLGRKLMDTEAMKSKRLNRLISVESLPAGLYYIRVTITDRGSLLLPFVKG